MPGRAHGRWTRALAALAVVVCTSPVYAAQPGEDSEATPPAAATEPAVPDGPLPGGFPSAGLEVPRSEIIAGGPGRDGIRSIDAPRFVVPAEAVRWVRDEHTVIGVSVGGDARAYPLHVLEHHQVVNDRFGDVRVVVAYDPLIDVARAYRVDPANEVAGSAAEAGEDAETGHAGRTFGVSGLIHRCNFVLYARDDESLWTQYEGRALTGEHAGERLAPLVVRVEPLGVWREREPATLVLQPPSDRRVDYRYSLYTTYWVSEKIPFPIQHADPRIHPKEIVLGARVGGITRAYLASVVEQSGGRIVDEIAGRKLRIQFDSDAGTFSWEAPGDVEMTSAYWFAWKNFHPETELWNVAFQSGAPAGQSGGKDEKPGKPPPGRAGRPGPKAQP